MLFPNFKLFPEALAEATARTAYLCGLDGLTMVNSGRLRQVNSVNQVDYGVANDVIMWLIFTESQPKLG